MRWRRVSKGFMDNRWMKGTAEGIRERVGECEWLRLLISRVFGSVVVVAFQIVFHVEIYANDVFLFFKNHFWYQHIKTIQKVQTALNFSKKKKLKFAEKQVEQQSQTLPSCGNGPIVGWKWPSGYLGVISTIFTKAPFVCWKVVSFWKVNFGESEFRESEFQEIIFRCLVV